MITRKLYYYLSQAVFTAYLLFNGLFWNGFSYMVMIGLANIVICFLILSRKRTGLIISLAFYVLIFLAYATMFSFMIVASFRERYINPFFLMAAGIHAPVLLFCFVAIIILLKFFRTQPLERK